MSFPHPSTQQPGNSYEPCPVSAHQHPPRASSSQSLQFSDVPSRVATTRGRDHRCSVLDLTQDLFRKHSAAALIPSSPVAAGQPARSSMIMRFQTPLPCVWPTSSARLSRSELLPAEGSLQGGWPAPLARRRRVPNQPTCPVWAWRCPKALRVGLPQAESSSQTQTCVNHSNSRHV